MSSRGTVELLEKSGLSSAELRPYYYVFDIHFLRCPVSINGRRLTQSEIWAYVDRMVAEAGLDPAKIRAEYHAIIKLTFKEGSIDERAFFPVGDAARKWAKEVLSDMELGEKLAHPEAVISAGTTAKAIVADPGDTERIWTVPSGARFASSDRAASQILSLLALRTVLPSVQTVASLGPPQRALRRLSARSTSSFTRRTRAPSTRSARSGGDASRRCRSCGSSSSGCRRGRSSCTRTPSPRSSRRTARPRPPPCATRSPLSMLAGLPRPRPPWALL